MKTIKELAEELGVSKTAVRKHLTPEFRDAHVQTSTANLIVIDDEGCKLIAESFRKPPQTTANHRKPVSANHRKPVSGNQPKTTANQPQTTANQPQTYSGKFPETTANQGLREDREEVVFLRAQLEAKDRQMEAKDKQIAAQQEQISQLTAALEHTTESLHAAQALHAGTMQQLSAAGVVAEQPNEVVPEDEPEQIEEPEQQAGRQQRRWWQFWR